LINITANKELVKQMRVVGRRNGEAEKISFTLGLAMEHKPDDKHLQQGLFCLLREHIQKTVTLVRQIEHEALLVELDGGKWSTA
jgi:hypothetical protein